MASLAGTLWHTPAQDGRSLLLPQRGAAQHVFTGQGDPLSLERQLIFVVCRGAVRLLVVSCSRVSVGAERVKRVKFFDF